MKLDKTSKKDLLDLAKTSSDNSLLKQLSKSKDVLVRRAVARNRASSKEVLTSLCYDPVLNISYMANKHHNSAQPRVFSDIIHPCVLCEIDERHLPCYSCEDLKQFKSS